MTYPGNNRRIKQKASLLSLMLMLLMVGGILLAAPLTSTTMAQQTTTTTTTTAPETTTTTDPLTPEELTEQSRLQNVTSAITRNLQQGEMRINGIVYTPRWSDPVWVQPNSLSVLFVYCLPGEYASSGQQILGSRDLNVLESYSLALSPVLTGWLMIVENEHQTERNPAAVGVICASDANDPQTRILSPQEQIVINNVVKQFITIQNTVINNITQIITIINNVTRPPPTNDTGGNTTDPLTVQAIIADIDQDATPVVLFETSTDGGTPPYTCLWDLGDGTTVDTCNVSRTYPIPGTYTAVVTVTDATGQTASDDTGPFNITHPETTGEEDGGGAVAEEPPAGTTTEGEDTTTTTTTTTMPPTTTMDSSGQ